MAMADLSRKIKTACAHAGISEAEVARRLDTTPQNFSKKSKTLCKKVEELDSLATAMGAELRLEFVFPDGFSV